MQTGNGGDLTNTIIRFTLWTSFSECSEGRGLGGSPMEGIFVEMDKGCRGGGSYTW